MLKIKLSSLESLNCTQMLHKSYLKYFQNKLLVLNHHLPSYSQPIFKTGDFQNNMKVKTHPYTSLWHDWNDGDVVMRGACEVFGYLLQSALSPVAVCGPVKERIKVSCFHQ